MCWLRLVILGAIVIAFLTALPAGFAHYDTGAHPNPGADGVPEGFFIGPHGTFNGTIPGGDWASGGRDRVSGWYYGSGNNPFIYIEDCSGYSPYWSCYPGGTPLPGNPGPLCPADIPETPPDENDACATLTSPIKPGFFFAEWSGMGDLEVGGVGSCEGTTPEPRLPPTSAFYGLADIEGDPLEYMYNELPDKLFEGLLDVTEHSDDVLIDAQEHLRDETATLNERVVEGADGFGDVDDGTFNDGGFGLVTHMDHYDCTAWNSYGCGYRYDWAMAEDLVLGRQVWIATQCNWGISMAVAAPGLDDPIDPFDEIVDQFIRDAGNCLREVWPEGCAHSVQYVDDCGLAVIPNSWTGSPVTCDWEDVPAGIVCGAGGISTTWFGKGYGTPFARAGHETTGYEVSCESQATASVFPFTAVMATAVPANNPLGWTLAQDPYVAPATYGWVA